MKNTTNPFTAPMHSTMATTTLLIATLLLTTTSCQKKRLSNAMCDCADSEPHVELSDTSWLIIPNVITSNWDGMNEKWTIGGIEYYPDAIVRVIDERLLDKKIIFESVGYAERWDGTRQKGKKHKDSKYKFEIEVPAGRSPGMSAFSMTAVSSLSKMSVYCD
jgi:gliding motility-associated-like protein